MIVLCTSPSGNSSDIDGTIGYPLAMHASTQVAVLIWYAARVSSFIGHPSFAFARFFACRRFASVMVSGRANVR